MVPNGVSRGRPPALTAPFNSVWQTAQSPSAANCRPRAMVAAENTDASGRAIGAIDRHGSTAVATPIIAAINAAALANAPRRLVNGFGRAGGGAASATLAEALGSAAGVAPCS